MAGVTEAGTISEELEGSLGYGPAETIPNGEGADQWQWFPATPGSQYGNDDEFAASLSPPEGNWLYVFRFRYGSSGPWRYCDTNGSSDAAPFDAADMGRLLVSP